LALAGCKKDICQRSAESAEACGQDFTDADMDACHASLEGCSKADEKLLDDYFDCLEDAGFMECATDENGTTGDDEDATAALLECVEEMASLSSECLDTLVGGEGGTTPTGS